MEGRIVGEGLERVARKLEGRDGFCRLVFDAVEWGRRMGVKRAVVRDNFCISGGGGSGEGLQGLARWKRKRLKFWGEFAERRRKH